MKRALLLAAALLASPLAAQQTRYTLDMLPPPGPLNPDPNRHPNPFVEQKDFLKLPPGRIMGSTSAVAVDSKGHIWVAERCGANACLGSPINPIMEFDAAGNFIRDFGGGMTVFPHGFTIDADDNIWLTDARITKGEGGQVLKFSPEGKLLLTLGTRGVAGTGPTTFTEPNAVAVARDGTIFVADGHTPYKGIARIVKFAPDGRYLGEFGTAGKARGEIEVPHALAFDSSGRLFVADRWNNRVSIFTQDGKFIDSWTQFGRPSGLFIDKSDTLYAADSESRAPIGYGFNPGWKRGIRIGDARTGKVTAFIPDGDPNPDAGATSGAEGMWVDNGTVYTGKVKERTVTRFVPAAK